MTCELLQEDDWELSESWESLELAEILGDESCCSFCWSAELLKTSQIFDFGNNLISHEILAQDVQWMWTLRFVSKDYVAAIAGVSQQSAGSSYWFNSKTLK